MLKMEKVSPGSSSHPSQKGTLAMSFVNSLFTIHYSQNTIHHSSIMKQIALILALTVLFFCSCGSNTSKNTITKEMAYEGVSNYCHSAYDWSIAEDNPDIMTLEMGEETDSLYQVVFRSYTGASVYFYVDKVSGSTRMVEHVPNLDIQNEVGTINLFDYF